MRLNTVRVEESIRQTGTLSMVIIGLFCLLATAAQAKYGGGNGTAEDPYLIYTPEQMNTIGLNEDDRDKHFKLMADLDLAGFRGDSFNLIEAFWGVFDGNGHTIANFTYTVSKGQEGTTFWSIREIGLFRTVGGNTAQIKNLGLIDPNVGPARGFLEPISDVGTLVGRLS